jgi:hypothetical protein
VKRNMFRVTSARVDGFSVMLTLADGTIVERDFSFMREGVLARLWRKDRLDPRVRVKHGALTWPNEIDFELDLILLGWPRTRRRRPLARALVGSAGALVPAPIVRDL